MREEIEWFAEQMESKLKENDHKPHWGNSNPDHLMNRMYQETKELYKAILDEPAENIIKECADVANFAMMIADNFSKREKKPSRASL